MSAQPAEFGPGTVRRSYNTIAAALPPALVEQFTDEFHSADVFGAPRVLEYFGRIADTLADPGTSADAERCVPQATGLSLDDVLAGAE
ncbi:hypothetical protein [Kitasatospora sp. NPDC002040]|uniref:hypothetical protein n=1 Tax=Kitasatospora sp. NPDC002040 TaxID=3154661 RepID=UPI0033199AB7